MKFNVIIKKEKYPSMDDKYRVVFKSVDRDILKKQSFKDELKELGLSLADVEIVKDIESAIKELDQQRNEELKGFVIDDIFMNEDIIKTMAVAFNIAGDDEQIEWIDISNKTVTFSKADFGALIKKGSQKVKEIYFKYRKLKDDLLKEA